MTQEEAVTKFCGIDLHANNSVVVICDEADRVVTRRRCPNDLPTVLDVLEPFRGEFAGVVVESTYNWYWLVDGLQARGYPVKLANTVAMRRYEGLKHSDVEDDAAHLAHLLRLGILPTGYIHPPEERAVRDLARKQIQLARSRTQIEAANFARRVNAQAKRFYARKKAKTNGIVATKALAHKLARACYHILKEAKPFDERRCFG